MTGPGDSAGTPEEHQRRRRRWWVAGISAGAAVVVIALCAGILSVINFVDDDERDNVSERRASHELRDQSCLELERRLNRLTPPGATAGPAGRAVAIRDENAAVRIYLGEIRDERAQDGWRQLLDARAVFADALDRQSKSRTPAFYLAPRAENGELLTTDLLQWSPTPCAGPLRRLAAPDL
jgi:hypothetical protein